MVSQPESAAIADRHMAPLPATRLPTSRQSSLPLPPPPVPPPAPASVASSSRVHNHNSHHSRHHSDSHQRSRSRYGGGRSHHGGHSSKSYAQMNEFPIFSATGDVEIVIRAADQERRYLLHRLILAQNSGFFEAGMNEEEWGSSTSSSRQGSSVSASSSGGGRDATATAIADTPTTTTAAAAAPSSGLGDASGAKANGTSTNGKHVVHMPAIQENLAVESTSRRAGATKTRWRYELDWENREEDEVPILVQKPPSVNNTLFSGEFSPRPPPPPPARTKPTAPQQGFFRTMANLTGIQSALHLPGASNPPEEQPVDPTIRDYDNLFRIFYNYPPQLNSVNIATAYAECKSLLLLADMYDALTVVGPRVDHHLLGFSSKLYKQIAKYPPSYLKLGYLARSRVIFSEALIHVVGKWPTALPHLGPTSYSPVPDVVLDLIEDKIDDLDDAIARIEGKLFRLTLTTSRGERVGPSNAYLDWLAVSLFRQWLVENTTPPPPSILKPLPSQPNSRSGQNAGGNGGSSSGNTAATTSSPNMPGPRQVSDGSASASAPTTPHLGPASNGNNSNGGSRSKQKPAPPPFSIGRTYRLLGSSSTQAYLTHDELKRFLKLHPSSDSLYSRENLKRFERKMDEIKRLAREIVKPLMRNFLELDLRSLGGGGSADAGASDGGMLLPYLTCTKVSEADFPW